MMFKSRNVEAFYWSNLRSNFLTILKEYNLRDVQIFCQIQLNIKRTIGFCKNLANFYYNLNKLESTLVVSMIPSGHLQYHCIFCWHLQMFEGFRLYLQVFATSFHALLLSKYVASCTHHINVVIAWVLAISPYCHAWQSLFQLLWRMMSSKSLLAICLSIACCSYHVTTYFKSWW